MRADNIMRANVSGLLRVRHITQHALAMWMKHDKSWINKFLRGQRQLQLKDLDRIADFFGLDSYQLFQPGTSDDSERRHGPDRRTGKERRGAPRQHVWP